MWELVAGNRTAVLPWHALATWISLNCCSVCQWILCKTTIKASDTLEHQPKVWPVPDACAQPILSIRIWSIVNSGSSLSVCKPSVWPFYWEGKAGKYKISMVGPKRRAVNIITASLYCYRTSDDSEFSIFLAVGTLHFDESNEHMWRGMFISFYH